MSKSTPRYQMACKSDPGMIRHLNEDAVYINPETGLAILADGMGGYSAGEVASAMAVDIISAYLNDSLPKLRALPLDEATAALHEDITTAVRRANTAIHTKSSTEEDCEGMGTTLVVAALLPGQITVAHVGDSRLYRFRDGELAQITSDHSWLDEQIKLGVLTEEKARESRYQNIVTRGLGIEPDVEEEINDYPLQPNDLFLLCSDGLSDMLDDQAIETILKTATPDLAPTCEQLINGANEAGGKDNVSAILVSSEPPPATSWIGRLSGILSRR